MSNLKEQVIPILLMVFDARYPFRRLVALIPLLPLLILFIAAKKVVISVIIAIAVCAIMWQVWQHWLDIRFRSRAKAIKAEERRQHTTNIR